MTAVAEKEKTELVTVPAKDTALAVFKTEQGLDPYLQTIRTEVDAFLAEPPSLDTAKGRQAYASMAHKIARSKTAIDTVGKELVAELKQLPKTIDAERKRWRDTLDAWRDEARAPLNEWEQKEEERKAVREAGINRMREFATELDDLDSQALKVRLLEVEGEMIGDYWQEYEAEAHRVKEVAVTTLRVALQKREQYEAEQAELARLRAEAEAREQQEREARIAREAEDRARQEAEQRAQAERDAAARRELEARQAAEQRERDAKEAAERREREHQEALAKAQRDAEQAAQRERERHEAEQRRQQQEAQRRQADKEHRGRVNRAALQAMLEGGMPEDCAKQAITLIVRGQVPGVTINY